MQQCPFIRQTLLYFCHFISFLHFLPLIDHCISLSQRSGCHIPFISLSSGATAWAPTLFLHQSLLCTNPLRCFFHRWKKCENRHFILFSTYLPPYRAVLNQTRQHLYAPTHFTAAFLYYSLQTILTLFYSLCAFLTFGLWPNGWLRLIFNCVICKG